MKRTVHIVVLFLSLFATAHLQAAGNLYLVIEQDTLALSADESLRERLGGIVMNFGDSGYPFTEAILSAYARENGDEYFHYRISKGEKTRIDTVVFGDYSLRERVLLSRYIDLPESGDFNYSRVRSMIAELKSNELLKVEERADIYENGLRLYTSAKQDIRLDAVVSYKQDGEKNGIVGDVRCELINLGGLGRVANFYWSRPTLGVNRIDLSYTEPYIFNKPLSLQGEFSQRYQDSLYVKRDLTLGLIYHIHRRAFLRIDYQNEYINTTDSGSDSGFVRQRRSGSDIYLRYVSAAGPLRFTLDARSGLRLERGELLSHSEFEGRLFLRQKRFGTNVHLLAGLLKSRQDIALYDQFKLGGAAFLRGAGFEQYRTTQYLGWQFESGYFYGSTRLFAFYDGVYMQHPQPLSHHIGLGFSLPAGNNMITIALGYNMAESLRQAKFHLIWDMGI